MPESPCKGCGQLVPHTDDDESPTCETCGEKLIWWQILMDIAEGKLQVQYDENGHPIVPGSPPLK